MIGFNPIHPETWFLLFSIFPTCPANLIGPRRCHGACSASFDKNSVLPHGSIVLPSVSVQNMMAPFWFCPLFPRFLEGASECHQILYKSAGTLFVAFFVFQVRHGFHWVSSNRHILFMNNVSNHAFTGILTILTSGLQSFARFI